MHYRSWASFFIDCAVISDSVQLFWRVNRPSIQLAVQTAHWHMFAVLRQLPHFPENCRGGGAFEKACEVQDQA